MKQSDINVRPCIIIDDTKEGKFEQLSSEEKRQVIEDAITRRCMRLTFSIGLHHVLYTLLALTSLIGCAGVFIFCKEPLKAIIAAVCCYMILRSYAILTDRDIQEAVRKILIGDENITKATVRDVLEGIKRVVHLILFTGIYAWIILHTETFWVYGMASAYAVPVATLLLFALAARHYNKMTEKNKLLQAWQDPDPDSCRIYVKTKDSPQ